MNHRCKQLNFPEDNYRCIIITKINFHDNDKLQNIWFESKELIKIKNLKFNLLTDCKNCETLQFHTPCPGISLYERKDINKCNSLCQERGRILKKYYENNFAFK